MSPGPRSRPRGVTALAIFFLLGAAIAAISCFALALPGGPLEPMWRINPRARAQFATMGAGGPLLMVVVSAACAFAAVGLWRGRRWGWTVAVAMLATSLAGDLFNALSGLEPRAWFGVPIAAAMLAYLVSKRVRAGFTPGDGTTRAERESVGRSGERGARNRPGPGA